LGPAAPREFRRQRIEQGDAVGFETAHCLPQLLITANFHLARSINNRLKANKAGAYARLVHIVHRQGCQHLKISAAARFRHHVDMTTPHNNRPTPQTIAIVLRLSYKDMQESIQGLNLPALTAHRGMR
jgi:hypothetical protein